MSKRSMMVLLAGVLVTTAGCAKDNAGGGMSRSDAERLKNEKTKSEMIQDKPLTADSHFAAGQVAETQEDAPRAIEQYNLALKLNPKHVGSLYKLALLYTGQRDFDSAIGTWRKYIAATNGSASGYSNLALSLEMNEQLKEAEAAYQTGVAREPTNRLCRVNYGLFLARYGRVPEATVQLEAVLTPSEVHYNLASVLEMQGRKDLAKAEYQKSIELDPKMDDAKDRLAALSEN